MARADEVGSSLVIANDPDADRLGAASATTTVWHVLRGTRSAGSWVGDVATMSDPRDVVGRRFVSSTLLREMARDAALLSR